MATFPKAGKPDDNWLEALFEPTKVPEVEKRAERMARSTKARGHRAEVKAIKNRRALRDREKK